MSNFDEIIKKINEYSDDKDVIIAYLCELLAEFNKKQIDMENRIIKLEEIIKEEIIDEEEMDLEINCPYCNEVVYVLMNGTNMDMKCPSCGKIIELEWDAKKDNKCDKDCDGGCCNK